LVDAEILRLRLRELDRRIVALREARDEGRERFLADPRLRAAVERHLQLALQSAIDAAAHVVAEDFPESPSTYREVFELLARHGVLDEGLASRLGRAAGLRNLLVHGYLELDPERIWASLGGLEDLVALAERLDAYVSGSA
jgi:uncharacterized protein YutE (UPF0331/DUF86 family)